MKEYKPEKLVTISRYRNYFPSLPKDIQSDVYARMGELIADRITQDMLIIGANQDHFIDYRLVGKEINMLKNVRSLTFRLFTDKEDAQNHCNVGNGKIVLDTICNWIEQIDAEGE